MGTTWMSILLIACILQFIIIFKLIDRAHMNAAVRNRNHLDSSGDIDRKNTPPALKQQINENDKTSLYHPNKDRPASDSFSSISQARNSSNSYDGVAVTVMLNTPKWFQKRYTMMIENTINNIPLNWVVQIFYTGKGGSQVGLDINPGIQKHIRKGKVVLTLLSKDFLNIKKLKKIQLLYSPWFWSNMLADRVLLFGGSSVICSNSPNPITSFTQYDYIGVPWRSKQGVGGGGGITIRNRNHMLAALEYARSKLSSQEDKENLYKTAGADDNFFVSTLLEMNARNLIQSNIAPKDMTYLFCATGGYANVTVFAASGTLSDLTFLDRDKFLQYCPELKMVYPNLHDPHCFGAAPNGEECAKAICALRPKETRKGGC